MQYYGLVRTVSSWGGVGYTSSPSPLVFDSTPPYLPSMPPSTVYPGIQTGDRGINWEIVDNNDLLVAWVAPADSESSVIVTYARVSIDNGPVRTFFGSLCCVVLCWCCVVLCWCCVGVVLSAMVSSLMFVLVCRC